MNSPKIKNHSKKKEKPKTGRLKPTHNSFNLVELTTGDEYEIQSYRKPTYLLDIDYFDSYEE